MPPEGGNILDSFIVVLFFTLLGACLGSFLNVVAGRSVAGASWWGGARSKCPKCGTTLSWKDLIPMLSWFFLRGRCRYCGNSIAFRYLGAELCGAAAGGLLAWRWGLSAALIPSLAAAFGLFLNALTDLEEGYVFDIFPLAMGICGFALRLLPGGGTLLDGILGAAAGFSVIALIILLSRGGMGWGDATLTAGTGVILGWKFTLLTLYLGFMAGGLFSLVLLAAGKLRRKDAVPLVPFLALGGLFTLLFGPWLLSLAGVDPGLPWR